MNLAAAILCPGLLLLVLGVPLVLAPQRCVMLLRAFPRSIFGAWVCFGSGAIWFLWDVWNLSEADFGEHHVLLFCIFGAISVLAFKYTPDFLAVRGLCILVLLAADPLLKAGYMKFDFPEVNFQKILIYVCIGLAIWLGAQPWRLRDFFVWLFARPARARGCGYLLLVYGFLLCSVAFSYSTTSG